MHEAAPRSSAGPDQGDRPKEPGADDFGLRTTPWEYIGGVTLMIVQSELADLQTCDEMLEGAVIRELAGFQRAVDANASMLSESERDEYYRFHSGSRWMLEELFPNIARTSMFLTCCALLEARLDQFCQVAAREIGTRLTLEDIHGKGIVRARIFLKKAVGMPFPDCTEQWREISTYGIIRNALAHTNGVLDDSRKRELVLQFANETHGLVKLTPAHVVLPQADFVPRVIATIGQFFEQLHSAWELAKKPRELRKHTE